VIREKKRLSLPVMLVVGIRKRDQDVDVEQKHAAG